MDETNLFLSSGSKKTKKKKVKKNYSHTKTLSTSTLKIDNIIIVFLIFTSIFFIIKIQKLKKRLKKVNNNNEKIALKSNDNIKLNNTVYDEENPTKRLFQYKEDIIDKNNNKSQIHISLAIDNFYNYPTLVSMTSILENNNKEKNIVVFHLLLSYNYNTTNIYIFESLKKNYEVKINYYIIPHIFKNFRTWSDKTDCIYYKILLPIILSDLDRIIYLDADTLTFKDLYEMYNLPFNDNYILGYPFQDVQKIDRFVQNATTYINGGVILLNIAKIREDKKDVELIQCTLENNADLWFLEQDSMNVVFHNKVGILPLKYGIYLYGTIKTFENSYESRLRIKLNKEELIKAIDDPSVVHLACCNPKVWNKFSRNDFGDDEICDRFRKDFYYFANKTSFYNEIYDKYMN